MGIKSNQIRQDIIAALQLKGSLNTLDLSEISGHSADAIGRMCYYMEKLGILNKEKVAHPTKGGSLIGKWTLITDENGKIKATLPRKVNQVQVSPITICLKTQENREVKLTVNDARYLYQQLQTLFGKV